jgi:NDP-sugar pyrophosphorylase family protein
MAGRGSRFAKVGFVQPKPLIDVAGKPMIRRVFGVAAAFKGGWGPVS